MEATVRATCPKCRSALRIPAQWLGQAVRCTKCAAVVRSKPRLAAAPADDTTSNAPYPTAPAAVPVAAANAFDFDAPSDADRDFPGFPAAAPAAYAPPAAYPAASPYAPPPGYPQPAPAAAFALDDDPGTDDPAPRRRRKGRGPGAVVWVGLCLLLTAGLVAGGLYGGNLLREKFAEKEKEPANGGEGTPATGAGGGTPVAAAKGGAFPRRLLFISVTKYMYLNPLTSGVATGGTDRPASAAKNLAFHWRVPADRDNDQTFVLSDTAGKDERLPMRNVVQGTYQGFFGTSRAQDRVFVYFGGHAVEKDGKAYLAPIEAELDGDGWQQTLIPLDDFYGELKKCPAAQKVVVWDVCRLNPEKGKVRPGSEPMSEGLYKALTAAPPGVQVITTCTPGENALEFTQLRPDGFSGPLFSGSAFLEAVRFVVAPANNRLPKATPAATDPLPVAEWHAAVAKRAAEMGSLAEKVGSGGKQTVALAGAAPAALPAPDPAEAAAAKFPIPPSPKGASAAEVRALAEEFKLPPLKPGLGEVALADFPFPAEAMREYAAPPGPSFAEVAAAPDKHRAEHPLRAEVVTTLRLLAEKWSGGTGANRIRTSVAGPINDALKAEVKKELDDFWATSIAELELKLVALEGDALKAARQAEPSKRWQAHYDFALAALKARLAYMNEYNKLMGNLVTESLPALDPKLGQDGYTLVAADALKSGKDVKKMAEEAQALFGEIATKYKGSPWAIQAKQERSVALGLNWKPASLKKE